MPRIWSSPSFGARVLVSRPAYLGRVGVRVRVRVGVRVRVRVGVRVGVRVRVRVRVRVPDTLTLTRQVTLT